jgi:hypothetical protein
MRHLLAILATLAAAPLTAQSTLSIVDTSGATRTLADSDLAALPQDTVRAGIHGGPIQAFTGPTLGAVLGRAGIRLDTLRGPALTLYVLAEARDGYRVTFAIGELATYLSDRKVIVARAADGRPLGEKDGPWRVVVEGERLPTRWIRQVSRLVVRKGTDR